MLEIQGFQQRNIHWVVTQEILNSVILTGGVAVGTKIMNAFEDSELHYDVDVSSTGKQKRLEICQKILKI